MKLLIALTIIFGLQAIALPGSAYAKDHAYGKSLCLVEDHSTLQQVKIAVVMNGTLVKSFGNYLGNVDLSPGLVPIGARDGASDWMFAYGMAKLNAKRFARQLESKGFCIYLD